MTPDPIGELNAAITLQRTLGVKARGDLEAAAPSLIKAIRDQSGQAAKLETLLWSLWNGQLSDALAGLDANLAVAAVSMISARAFLGGDAEGLLRQIIGESGTQPPAVVPDPDKGGYATPDAGEVPAVRAKRFNDLNSIAEYLESQ